MNDSISPKQEKRRIKPQPDSDGGVVWRICEDCEGTGWREERGEDEMCELCQHNGWLRNS